jgi:hypothetical protein
MISRLFGAVFTPKFPRRYTGRHRASSAPRRSGGAVAARTARMVGRETAA